MKKVLIILVFMMTALAVNAQAKATTTHAKPAAMVVKIAIFQNLLRTILLKILQVSILRMPRALVPGNVVTYEVNIVKGMDKDT